MKEFGFCSLNLEEELVWLYVCAWFVKICVIKEKLIQLKAHCKGLIFLLKTLHLLPLVAAWVLWPAGIRLGNTTAPRPLLCRQVAEDKSDLLAGLV